MFSIIVSGTLAHEFSLAMEGYNESSTGRHRDSPVFTDQRPFSGLCRYWGRKRERERDGVCVSVDTGRMNAHLFPRLSLKTQNHGGYLCSVNLPGHVLVDTENVILLLERNTNPSQFWLISIFLFASG